ncbi:MAG: peptidase S41 [Bacteroidetes bacterium 4572_112]|nr:MAG: peptidase S41 [Bacteroidetes bacterium 4572_112]
MRIFPILILLLLFLNTNILIAQESHDFEISKNLDIYTSLIQQLDLHYVDEIEPGTLSKAAIDAMLKQIDPYTVYYPESEIEDVRFMQTGKYGGVGTTVHRKNNEVVVGATYPGFPFYRAGIRAGDILLKVDGENISGKSMNQIADKMRGASGTEVTVLYRKSKSKEEVSVVLKREEIQMKDVPYFGILQDSIGYIKLSSFRKTATQEIIEALDSMSRSNGLNSLVLDLRGNGGGLLIESVKIMDLFVGAKELIVSTKGKTKAESHNYSTRAKAFYPNMKVVVLVDNNSASASEIVSGSFQDLDRGVIMGQKTFGKGLVQKVFTLSYRSQAKITVAKYYIPSGRCIQSLDYQHKDAKGHAIKTPDSLMAVFKTRNGRKVKDAGGVIPDVVLEQKKYDELMFALMSQYMIFDFATNYVNTHDSVSDIDKLVIDDNVYNSFLSFVKADSFVFKTNTERELNLFADMAKDDGYDLSENIDAIQMKIDIEKTAQYKKNKELIKSYIYQEIASRYAYDSGRVYIALKNDADVKQAIKLLNDTVKYNNILKSVQ